MKFTLEIKDGEYKLDYSNKSTHLNTKGIIDVLENEKYIKQLCVEIDNSIKKYSTNYTSNKSTL